MNPIELNVPDLSNAGLLSGNTLTFLVILFIVIFIISSAEKIIDIIFKIIGLILIFQIFYILGLTPIDDILYISTIFKYDFFTMIGALFPGTYFANILSYIGNELTTFMIELVNIILIGDGI